MVTNGEYVVVDISDLNDAFDALTDKLQASRERIRWLEDHRDHDRRITDIIRDEARMSWFTHMQMLRVVSRDDLNILEMRTLMKQIADKEHADFDASAEQRNKYDKVFNKDQRKKAKERRERNFSRNK